MGVIDKVPDRIGVSDKVDTIHTHAHTHTHTHTHTHDHFLSYGCIQCIWSEWL